MSNRISADYKFVITVIIMTVITILSILFGFILGSSVTSYVDNQVLNDCSQQVEQLSQELSTCTL